MSDQKKHQITHEVQRQFLRRTPIKLKQFSRLLNDMVEESVDPLRIKALLSQVTKTREACISQQFESTARLLNQLMKQLSMSTGSLDSQVPLLKRLSKKLLQHAEKLELGVKPQKEKAKKKTEEKTLLPVSEDHKDESNTNDLADDEFDLNLGFYTDKSKIILVSDTNSQNEHLSHYFHSLGIDCCLVNSLEIALDQAKEQPGCIIVSSLQQTESCKVLDDKSVEEIRTPLIFTADEDNQENRARAVRNGGTGFITEPVSISNLCEQIESLIDLHVDTPKRILVMEDSKAQARYYEKVLNKGPFTVRVVNDPSVFLEALRGFDPETVLMDMQMPDSSGVELTQIIRQIPRYSHLPIIFLSAEENLRKQNQALMSGGTAFIVKPVQKEQLMFLTNLYTQRYRNINPQIEINPETNLPYSAQFKQMIALETARMTRNPSSVALAIIYLDELSNLESTASYSFINNAIQQLAQLLKKRLRKTDIIGHIDEGKLGVILTSGQQKDWVNVMETVQQQFSLLPFHLQNESKPLTISIGVSKLSLDLNAHQWFELSSHALNQAIEKGPSNLIWKDSDN